MSDGEITVATSNGDDSPLCRQVTAVDNAAATPVKTMPFQLPEGWTVRKVPRSDGIREDKYYYEPGTGKKFESMRAVERHLTGAKCTPSEAPKQGSCFEKYYNRRIRRKVVPLIADDRYFPGPEHKSPLRTLKKRSNNESSCVRKSIVSGGKLLELDNEKLAVTPHTKAATSPFNLPDGWVVKEVPRRNTTKYKGYADKIYFEPGTGRRFLSLISVRRHLAEAEEDKPLAVMFNVENQAKKLDSKKINTRKKTRSSTFKPETPPARIKWVLTDDSGGCTFKPSIGESMVPDYAVQQWINRFMISINGDN